MNMNKEIKLTQKQQMILDLVKASETKSSTCYDLIENNKDLLKNNNIDTTKINSVNATLASLATKGLLSKSKIAKNDKFITLYTFKSE